MTSKTPLGNDLSTPAGSLVGRRRFIGDSARWAASAALLGGASLGGTIRSGWAGDAAAGRPAGKFIDVHTHLGQTWNSTQVLTAEVLLRWMDSHEIAQAVVLPLVSPESSSYPLTSDFVLAQTAPFRDRLIPFCAIDPRTSFSGGRQGLRDMLFAYAEAGAKGFGEHKPGVPIDDLRSMDLYWACGEVGLPVLFHLDNQRNTDDIELSGLEKALRENEKTIFIGHGPGWWASIAGGNKQSDLGGYPKGEVAPGGAIDRLMEAYPNVYGDLSAGSGANAISRDPDFGPAFVARRADRLMFGTDFLAPGQEVSQFEVLTGMELPADVEAKVFRDNARRVLGLD
jgi:hypothetical protein